MTRRYLKTGLLAAIFTIFVLASFAKAGIELQVSPINAPVMMNQDDDFDIDYGQNGDDKQAADPGIRGEDTNGKKTVSKTKAVLLSLLVPGAGHMYADAGGRGEIFMGTEVAIWVGYIAFNTYGHWKEDDYVRYATRYAAIDPAGKDDEFYRNLTFYDDRDEYDKSGRIIDPSSPYYAPNSGYDWYWESETKREEYRSMRNASKTAFRKATFMIGVAVFNRILSGIDAFRVAQKKSSEMADDTFFGVKNVDVDLKGNPFGHNPRVGIEISRRFK